jgi:large subunit ribosomal protein L13
VVDAQDVVLGRLASEVAKVLMGKHKPTFVRHLDSGDYVIVVNAAKIRVTGDKLNLKMYSRHSDYPGGFRQRTLATMMDKFPERVIEIAVKGMLPHNRLGAAMIKKLKVYSGPSHDHAAQQPKALTLTGQRGEPSVYHSVSVAGYSDSSVS